MSALAEQLGQFVGAIALALGGSTILVYRSNKRLRLQMEPRNSDVSNLKKKIAMIEVWQERANERHEEIRQRLGQIEDRQQHFVTDEEFAAYTGSTTASINQLTEKAGRAAGMIEVHLNATKGR